MSSSSSFAQRLLHWFQPHHIVQLSLIILLALLSVFLWFLLSVPSVNANFKNDNGRLMLQAIGGFQLQYWEKVSAIDVLDLPIAAIKSDQGGVDNIDAKWFTKSFYFSSREKRQEFFRQQASVQHHFDQDKFTLIFDGQEELEVEVFSHRSISSLSWSFWFPLISSTVAIFFVGGVLSSRPQSKIAWLLFVNGVSFASLMLSEALLISREFVLPVTMHFSAWMINEIAVMLYVSTLVGLVLHYPQRLTKWPLASMLFLLHVVLLAQSYIPNQQPWGLSYPVARTSLMASIGVVIIILQWFICRQKPIERSMHIWLSTSIFITIFIYIALWAIPTIYSVNPIFPSWLTGTLLLLTYLGFGLGIFRVKLFAVDRVLFNVWLWVVGGAVVVAIDLMLISWFSMQPMSATALAILLVGWVYFPVRQLLLIRFSSFRKGTEESLSHYAGDISVSDTPQEFAKAVEKQLTTAFNPYRIERQQMDVHTESCLHDSGLVMSVIWPEVKINFLLTGKYKNRYLFSPKDLSCAKSYIKLANQTWQARCQKESLLKNERERIGRDLHDNVSSPLLSLMRRSNDDILKGLATDAFHNVRDAIYMLEDNANSTLDDVLNDCQDDIESRLLFEGINLTWQEDELDKQLLLKATDKINLLAIFKEACTNIIRHSQATTVRIKLVMQKNQLSLLFENDGVDANNKIIKGRGLNNIEQRAAYLNGSSEFYYQGAAIFVVQVKVYLQDNKGFF